MQRDPTFPEGHAVVGTSSSEEGPIEVGLENAQRGPSQVRAEEGLLGGSVEGHAGYDILPARNMRDVLARKIVEGTSGQGSDAVIPDDAKERSTTLKDEAKNIMRKNKFLRALTVEDSPVSGQSVLRSGSINISQAVRALTNVVRTKDHPGFKMDVDMHNSEDFITRIGRSVSCLCCLHLSCIRAALSPSAGLEMIGRD